MLTFIGTTVHCRIVFGQFTELQQKEKQELGFLAPLIQCLLAIAYSYCHRKPLVHVFFKVLKERNLRYVNEDVKGGIFELNTVFQY